MGITIVSTIIMSDTQHEEGGVWLTHNLNQPVQW
jgi:hypothetical protein